MKCGKETDNPRFCGHSCAASYNNHKRAALRRSANRKRCGWCESELADQRKVYCDSNCFNEHRTSKVLEKFLSDNGSQPAQLRSTVRRYVLDRQNGVCARCGAPPVHNALPLTFVLDHVDGNHNNNRPDNLRLLCPNCDTQLPTFGAKNLGKGRAYRRERYREGKSC